MENVVVKRKGRPKGSKNKVKKLPPKKIGDPEKKVVDKNIELVDDDVPVKKKRNKSPEYLKEPCQFVDSIDVVGGDARKDFNIKDDYYDDNIWCIKREFTMYPKLCGRYVTPKCKKRFKCRHYEYGMEVKHRYRLKTVEVEPKKKATIDTTVEESNGIF
jgi:hypothetical protein